jgi:ribosome-associated protein
MTKLETGERLKIVEDALEDRKAEDVSVLDIRGRTLLADYFVIACGTSNIHIRSVVDGVVEKMKKQGQRPERVEGYTEAKWILVDFGDVVVHVFAKEEREFYDLETLWKATEERLGAR